jgi:putative tricarboxylic transport membrane protein
MKKLFAIVLTGMLLVAGCGTTKPAAAPSSSGGSGSSSTSAPATPKVDFPTKTVTLVAHTAPGGGADVFARQSGKALQNVLGKTVVIDNRSGGSGAIALQYAAEAKPDGYTVLSITDTMIITPLNNQIPKDLTAFKPVSRLVVDPNVLYVKADSKWTLDSMLEAITKGSANVKWAASQAGTPETMAMETLISKYKAKINSVMMGDGSKAITAVLSGDCEASIAEVAEILPQLQAKQLKVLAVFNSQRIPAMNDIPTMAEKGYPDLVLDKFRGYAVPKDTPDEIVKILEDSFKKVLEDPDYKKTYTNNMQIPAYQGSADLQKTIDAKRATYKTAFGK